MERSVSPDRLHGLYLALLVLVSRAKYLIAYFHRKIVPTILGAFYLVGCAAVISFHPAHAQTALITGCAVSVAIILRSGPNFTATVGIPDITEGSRKIGDGLQIGAANFGTKTIESLKRDISLASAGMVLLGAGAFCRGVPEIYTLLFKK
jgi:hypothetical protein